MDYGSNVYSLYLYDGGGKRIKKLVRKPSGWESVTYVDGVFEYHKKDSEEKNYIQLGAGIEIRVGEYSDDSSSTAVVYQLRDRLGSVGIRISQSGSTIDREEYYPFGDSSLRTFGKKRYRYCGKEKDEESGLYYYGMRYYMPWVCRFISVDPLASKYAHLTPFAYADNQPINLFDIDGSETKATEITPQGGDKSSVRDATMVNKNPPLDASKVNYVNETPSSVADKAFEVVKEGIEKYKDYAEKKADAIEENNKLTGRKVDNYGKTRQSPGVYKNQKDLDFVKPEDRWKDWGGKTSQGKVTTKGQGYVTSDVSRLRARAKYIGDMTDGVHGSGLLGVFDLVAMAQAMRTNGNMVSAINPIGMVMDDQLDEIENSIINSTIKQGYLETKKLVENSKIYKDYMLVYMNGETFGQIKQGNYSSLQSITDTGTESMGYAVLVKITDRYLVPYATFIIPQQ